MGNTISFRCPIQLSSFPQFSLWLGSIFCLNPLRKQKARLASYSAGSMSKSDGNDIMSLFQQWQNISMTNTLHAEVQMWVWEKHRFILTIAASKVLCSVCCRCFPLEALSLYVPSDWRVHVHVDNSLSAIQHQENPSALTSKDFYITGDVSLGNLEIIYVGANSFS